MKVDLLYSEVCGGSKFNGCPTRIRLQPVQLKLILHRMNSGREKKGRGEIGCEKQPFSSIFLSRFAPFWPLPSSTRSTEVRYSTGFHSVIRFALSHFWIRPFFIPETKIFKANFKVKNGQVGAMPKIHFRLEMNWLTVLLFVNYLPNLHTRSLPGKWPNEIFDRDCCQYYLLCMTVMYRRKILLRSFHLTVFHRFNLTQQQQRDRKALSASSRF